MIRVRKEGPHDRDAIRIVNRTAFDGEEEVELIGRLWADGDVVASLVALDGDEVVGHILFSDLPIETQGGTVRGAALAPLAVLPDRQRIGFGTALVQAGLNACCNAGMEAVVVLGHEEYYPRFGFSARLAERLDSPFSGAAFMALELVPGALDIVKGNVRYPPAFGLSTAPRA